VHEAEEISPRDFCGTNVYDLVMPHVRSISRKRRENSTGEIKGASPQQQFAFLMGPPRYLSRTWPGELARVTPRADSGVRR